MSELEKLYGARDHFALFSLPVRFTLDRPELERRYLELARLTHPDFAGSDAEAQVQALELSARVNEAYGVLSDDLKRAEYLVTLGGCDVEETKLAPEMLEKVFELREALSLAQSVEDEAGAGQ